MVQVCSSRIEDTQFKDYTKHSDDAVSTLDRNSALVSMKKKKYRCGQRTVRLAVGDVDQLNISTKQSTQSSRAGASDTM
ncbi:hypothetical protein TNCV_2440721 [Trichonephila clavipes]|nr:hypothetical protein TNCV_2440721 [Trichonephila clavipes]